MTKVKAIAATPTLVGVVDQAQIDKWKKQFDVTEIPFIEVRQEGTDEVSVAYFKPADRDALAMIMSLHHNSKIVEAGEVAISNCWLSGDERLRNPKGLRQERTAVRAAQLAFNVVMLPEGFAGLKK